MNYPEPPLRLGGSARDFSLSTSGGFIRQGRLLPEQTPDGRR